MRSLEQALYDHELIVLRVIGEWWELDLTGLDRSASAEALAERLAGLDMALELQYLDPEEAAALMELQAAGGRLPVATFSRKYGELRLMGPGRLEREEPWLDPANTAEALWYRGFLYRGFDETAEGLIEFYYIPDELLAGFPAVAAPEAGRTAAGAPLQPLPAPAESQPAPTDAVDDLTALLALAQRTALQSAVPEELGALLVDANPDRRSLLLTLAEEMGLLRIGDNGVRPTRAAVAWLKESREAQLRALADAWSSSSWNELCHTPGLACEGEGWRNDPILARTALLDALPHDDGWYSLGELAAAIRESDPDFQRPDGNYETWYIRDTATDTYLAGFESWEQVEGRLIPFLVQGPLFWLGLADTAAGGLYRLTPRALDWLAGRPPAADPVRLPLIVQPDASLLVPPSADRYQRFQVARISQAEAFEPGKPFSYRLTPRSLAEARQQGITPERVLHFLEEASGRPVPAGVRRAVARWSERGVEGRLEAAVILRVSDGAILETLLANPKTRDFIGERLGDLAAVVRPGSWAALRQTAAQLGLLLECEVP